MMTKKGFSNLLWFPLSITLLLTQWSASAAETAGEVVSTEGVVFIRPDGADSKATQSLKPAKPGDHVLTGDVVNTSSNGKIKIYMADKSIVDLGPSTLFKVDAYAANQGKNRQVDVSILYGTMRTSVTQKIEGNGRYRVRTPTTTMGVRGTEFIVKSEIKDLRELQQSMTQAAQPQTGGAPASDRQAKTEITVVQGEIAVSQKDSNPTNLQRKPGSVSESPTISLKAGMQISSREGETRLAKPVFLDTKQLMSTTSTAKFADNTFVKAVVVDLPSGNSNTNSPAPGTQTAAGTPKESVVASAGTATVEAIKTAIAEAPPVVLAPVVFTQPVDIFNPVPVNTQAGMKKLRVVVVLPQ